MRSGIHRPLEDEANRLIRESLKGVTKHSDKLDILTPWKERYRSAHETYVASGTPEPATRRGMFHRTVNSARPELNSREGVARARPGGFSGSLATFMQESGRGAPD